MGTGIRTRLRQNLGTATLVSMFVASLLLNVELGPRFKMPARREPGVKVGTIVKALPVILADGSGQTVRLDDGKETVLYVMAPDCHWCAKNLENIRALGKSTLTYRFLGLSNTAKGLPEYLSATPLPFIVHAVDTDHLPNGFDPSVTPQLVLIRSDGRVDRVWRGALGDKSKKEVEQFFHVTLPGA